LLTGGRRIVATGCAAWSLLMAVVTFSPVLSWWAARLSGAMNDPAGDILIVLAGDRTEPGMIGRSSYWRSVYAVWAWRSGGFRRIVLSGERTSTEPMRDFLACQGVPVEAILLEPRSASTRENAQFTVALLRTEGGKKVLLTSDFHMYRARTSFEKAGLAVLPRPFPDAAKRISRRYERWSVFCELLEETIKIGYYYARGWI
jgi:uncharacterized SAM-binding protein YcdF (DUF218 family)